MQRFVKRFKRVLYVLSGKIPWYPGYNEYRIAQIEQALSNRDAMVAFRDFTRLPIGYGNGIDERMVEYPWLLSRIGTSSIVLDAGGTLNHDWILARPELNRKRVVIYTLAPESYVKHTENVSYIYGDLRETVLRNDQFDLIACISTLEHVGMDNTVFYSKQVRYAEQRPEDFLQVVDELKRLIKPGGRVLVTVPYGAEQNHGWFQQFTSERVQLLLDRFQPIQTDVRYYAYSSTGWQIATAEECNDAVYFDFHRDGRKRNSDNAAAARAVACIELTK